MSDWQQPPQPYVAPPAGMPPAEPRPRRTGLIIALVVAAVLLLCCCSGTLGLLILSASSDTPSAEADDPKETARLAAWEAAKAAFPLSGYETIAPNARHRKLAEAATALHFPDFALDEVLVQPGSYDDKTDSFQFDEYVVLMHLKADPTARVGRNFFVSQPEADSLERDTIDVDPDEALDRIAGTSWLLDDIDNVPPLMDGVKDPTYAELLAKVAADWPGGIVVRLQPASGGTAKVRIFTWESYSKSEATAYIDAVYEESGGEWRVQSYNVVDDDGSAATPTS